QVLLARVAPCLDEPLPRARFDARDDGTAEHHSSRALGLRATRDASWRATVGAVRPVVAGLADRGSQGPASGGWGHTGARVRPRWPAIPGAAKRLIVGEAISETWSVTKPRGPAPNMVTWSAPRAWTVRRLRA